MPLSKKVYRIKCVDEPCEKLAEAIGDRISLLGEYNIRIENNYIIIELYGYESDIKKAWFKIKSLLGVPAKGGKGLAGYRLDYFFRELGATFSPRILVEVLKRRGFVVETGEDASIIYTNAGREIVVDIARRIIELSNNIPKDVKGSSTRYYLVTLGVLTGVSIQELVDKAVELGHIRRDREGLRLAVEWVRGVEEFLKRLKLSNGI
ncbi:DUF2067 family protein [Thermogladius sp. 4427co]|uniref:DUF2067 family protein n=1 Tax=Thermogladius sp. 4427co TaxID=3450718 RepID=UPI003F79BF8B